MIKKIHVKNYVLIDELTVDFDGGLNVITGETGAGKSILINAIDIVFGAKTTKEIVKSGTEKATVELFIENKHDLTSLFEKNGIDNWDEEIVLCKEITQTSSRTRVNGTLVNQEFIKDLKDIFLDIHSQHQTYSFLQPKSHILLLDNYAKDVYGNELAEYKQLYKDYQVLLNQLDVAKSSAESTESQIDFLKFQLDEISAANIQNINEEEILQKELSILENAEKLKEFTSSAYWALSNDDNSILNAVYDIKSNISKATKLDDDLESIEEKLLDVSENLKDISSSLRGYSQGLASDEARLNIIQERLHIFDIIKRKYGKTLEAVLLTFDKLSKEYELIEFSTKNIDELESKIQRLFYDLTEKAKIISEKRKNYAEVLSSLVVEELEKLELQKSRFQILVEEKEISPDGIDNVEFFISTNVSENLKPLIKVASGGEVSRVMLAIKTIFAQSDDIDTVIFDEIDTGISGRAAQSVADEILALSKFRQIILITHHAIIASKADRHFLVTKTQSAKTSVNVITLSGEEKITALAQLASGDISTTAIDFARSLLKNN